MTDQETDVSNNTNSTNSSTNDPQILQMQQPKQKTNTPSWITTADRFEIIEKVINYFFSPLRKKITKSEKLEQMENNSYTSTAELNRRLLKIFQYTDRPDYHSSREIFRFAKDEKEYVVFAGGKIGMNHKELLDIILYSAKEKVIVDKNKLAVRAELYAVKKAFNFQSASFYADLLKDLKMAQLFVAEIDSNNKYTKTRPLDGFITDFEIIESNKYDNKQALDIKVVLSQFLTNCFYSQIMIYYDPFPVSEFKWGINKAIANFLKSHKPNSAVNYKFKTLYETLGITGNYKNFNHRIKQESDIYLKNGFFIDKKNNTISSKNIKAIENQPNQLPQTQIQLFDESTVEK